MTGVQNVVGVICSCLQRRSRVDENRGGTLTSVVSNCPVALMKCVQKWTFIESPGAKKQPRKIETLLDAKRRVLQFRRIVRFSFR